MRIDRIEGYLVRLPLKKEIRFADTPVNFCESVLLRIEGDGLSGWSEVAPGNSPILTSEWTGATYLTLRDYFAPAVAATRAVSNSDSIAKTLASYKGNNYAKAALEMAWQDLNARIQKQPLWKALGGEKNSVKVGLTFDRSVVREEFFKELQRAVDDCFARVTLKLRPGWDVQVLNFARLDSPHWLKLMVDVEGGLDFMLHSDTIYRMDDFFLTCVEQPLDPRDFVVHAMLKDNLRTPVCLDESIESISDARIAFDLGCCKFVCLKPGRVGGMKNALDIAALGKNNEVGAYSGFELGSSLSWRYTAALASAGSFELPTDYIRFGEVLDVDTVPALETTLVEEPGTEKTPPRSFRYVELWNEPGVGVDPDLEALAPYVLDKFEVKA